jgi:hypothetical protein
VDSAKLAWVTLFGLATLDLIDAALHFRFAGIAFSFALAIIAVWQRARLDIGPPAKAAAELDEPAQ